MTDEYDMQDAASTTTEPTSGQRYRAMELDRHIGERLRFMRRMSCLSQRQVADEIGLSFQQLQKYESGSNRVSAAMLAEFSGLYHLPMDWFIGPFNAYHEREASAQGGDYAFTLEKLFGAFRDRTAAECDAALALLCQIAQVNAGPGQTRLFRLRRAMRDGTPDQTLFLREVVTRLAEAHAGTAAWPGDPASTPAAPMPSPRETNLPGAAPRVLLVDDDADVRTMLSASLGGAGFQVIAARNGDEALSLLGSDPRITAIVTDFAMVGIDGVELLAQAAAIRPEVGGLVITGFADAARLRDLPPEIEVLNKPFRRTELIGRVRLLMEGGRGVSDRQAGRPELTLVK